MMYYRKMFAHIDNDKLLIYCFQDSLDLRLDRTHIRSWKKLARASFTQHKHATNFTPDRCSLQTMEKKYDESFKDYALRWRTMATQVQPPFVEKEITMLFLNTL